MIKSETPEYSSWEHMNQRCNNKHHKHYARYGGRGIRICRRWKNFDKFLADMGAKPTPEHTLDRIDGRKGYNPLNCRWATRKEQALNHLPRSPEARRQQTAAARHAILTNPVYRKRLLERAAKARRALAALRGVPKDPLTGRFTSAETPPRS